jgi:hypothetical protein
LTGILQNTSKNYYSKLGTNDFNFNQTVLFTRKISKTNVLQLSLIKSINNVPQNFFLTSQSNDSLDFMNFSQFSGFSKNITTFQSALLGRTKKNKYTFSVGTIFEKNHLQSNLIVNNINNNEFTNNSVYNKYSIYNKGTYEINFHKWKFSPSYTLNHLQQKLTNNPQNLYKSSFFIEPTLSVRYKFNSISGILGKINYAQKTLSEIYLFNHPINISNRMNIENSHILKLQKVSSLGIIYLTNNLYKQFRLNLGINSSIIKGNFFPDIHLNENTTQVKYFYLPESIKNTNINFLIEKYIPLLESNIRVESNYSLSMYKNIVNNSDLRNNNNTSTSSKLFLKTNFESKINFENEILFTHNISKSSNLQKNINNFINNSFKVVVKPNKNWLLLSAIDYYLPNALNSKERILFLDGTIRYTPKHKKYELSLVGKNITNNLFFTQINTSDFSLNYFQTNLIPMYIMINLNYSF